MRRDKNTETSCNPATVRLQCLQLAVQSSPGNFDEAMNRAEKFVQFVYSADKEKSPA